MSMARIRKAQILMAQGNPTLSMSWLNMIGKMTPPMLDPAATIPMAKARRLLNQVEIALVPDQTSIHESEGSSLRKDMELVKTHKV